MTDEKNIKALEDYIKENEFEYFHSNMMNEYPLIKKSLDIINRQKSEIERLKGSTIVNNIMESQRIKREAKAEAYKEFADMVKKNIKEVWNYDNGTCSCVLVLTKDIDKILKEIVGEKE